MPKDFYLTQGLFPGLPHQFVIQGSHVLPWPPAHGKHQMEPSTCPGRRPGGGQGLRRAAAGIMVAGE
jgi:hypothetical protein